MCLQFHRFPSQTSSSFKGGNWRFWNGCSTRKVAFGMLTHHCHNVPDTTSSRGRIFSSGQDEHPVVNHLLQVLCEVIQRKPNYIEIIPLQLLHENCGSPLDSIRTGLAERLTWKHHSTQSPDCHFKNNNVSPSPPLSPCPSLHVLCICVCISL
jgi:hypothetical protein